LTDVVNYIKSNQEVIEKRYEPNFDDAYAEEADSRSKDDFSF
jgi:hypothetical protein